MTYTICYFFIFLAETFTSAFYFENKFERKVNNKSLIIFMISYFIFLYVFRLFNLTWLNVIAFFILSFLFLLFCYNISIKKNLFQCCLLLIFNVLTESIVMFASSALIGTELLACLDNSVNLIFQATLSKLLYFCVMYFISKISIKEKNKEIAPKTIVLFILPISSVLITHSILYALAEYKLKQTYLSLLVIGIVFLLISNLIVFWLYEFTLKTNRRNIELEIEQQKEKSTTEYYELLNKQNESSKILIHDIKRHLNTIKEISQNNNAVNNYISNIIEDFNVNKTIEYCHNPMVNVITNRYIKLCETLNIKMNVDIRNTDFHFMKEPDITALLDNMLENAVEAAKNAKDKFIDFSICIRKNKYLSITVTNSTDRIITIINNSILTSKKSNGIHGMGLKSIKRVVNKYEGEINMSFNKEEMTFSNNVVFSL